MSFAATSTITAAAQGPFAANNHTQRHTNSQQQQPYPSDFDHQQSRSTTPRRSVRLPASSASTPNLNSVYLSANRRAAPSGPSRKTSLAALTPSSLASIPDVSESYGYETVLSDPAARNMAPATPGKSARDDIDVGDSVDVPGGMQGVVRFVGQVQGKKGTFAGVELNPDYAARGKNNGDVDGVSYFTTNIAGAGIFLPVAKALRRDSPGGSSMNYPMTPVTNGLKAGNQNSTNHTPPTPSLPKFSASVGPGTRAPSPQGRRARTSLPRPDSPVRRTQMTPGPRPSIATPAKPTTSRYGGSPTNRFAQSVRGTAGDPSKRPKLDTRPSLGPRSASALGSAPGGDDREGTPFGNPRATKNGSVGSSSSLNAKMRPPSRANAANDEEMERLRVQLEDRERQLRDQASTLADMESSLTELQSLMEHSDVSQLGADGFGDKDVSQLRQVLREKNEKIAMLTAEFDAHRADFRSTIDTLELASTETERVYEKRMEELMGDIRELESRNLDVDSVASQLRQLEELVQELEEGLEDARRGEAEARGEVEFLRGEVERTRAELRREREKPGSSPAPSPDKGFSPKDMEQKEDEIRGLKAIIHSLSRDSVPNGSERPRRISSLMGSEAVENKIARDNLERQVAELQSILDKRGSRELELEQELEALRVGNPNPAQGNPAGARRSSLRDSRDTVILSRDEQALSPDGGHRRQKTLDTMPESDNHSTATENSTLWCEICETGGHDILTCTNMFGPDGAKTNGDAAASTHDYARDGLRPHHDDAHVAPLSPAKSKASLATPMARVLPNPMESGPVAGKESGVTDPNKWCAVCERDGHDSVDCPFEDAF